MTETHSDDTLVSRQDDESSSDGESQEMQDLLSVKDLITYFFTEEGIVRAVEGVSFDIKINEVLGLVGETGCGKSVTALSIIQLVRQPGRIMGGHVFFKGEDLLDKTEDDMRQIRGKNITMIFQDPMNSLNPVFTVERQLNEVFLLHQKQELSDMKARDLEAWNNKTPDDLMAIDEKLADKKFELFKLKEKLRDLKSEVRMLEKMELGIQKEKLLALDQNEVKSPDTEQDESISRDLKENRERLKDTEDEMARVKIEVFKLRAERKNPSRRKLDYYATLLSINALREVKIHTPETIIKSYPHELSGGMRQRVMIAMALACNPELLIADEPTTALDVTIQAQILDLMRQLKQKLKTSILIITHDLGTIAEMCDRVAVMYSGRIVEYGNVYTLFKDPKHPYTQGLMRSIPDISVRHDTLPIIPGTVPNLIYPPSGCRFHPRCPHRMVICDQQVPPFYEVDDNYFAACFLHAKTGKINGMVQNIEYPDGMFKEWKPTT